MEITGPDKYSYSRYSVGFDKRGKFLLSSGGIFGWNLIKFGIDQSYYVHADNSKKGILIFGKGPADRLDDNTLTAEAKYCINITEYLNIKTVFVTR